MVLFPVLLIALIGTGFWGYQEHQEKNSILIKAENQYQRAFHDLSYHVNRLHTELGNTLAVNSNSSDAFKKGLINVWRITTQAQNEINQLPLTLLPFDKTEELLANISNFAYQTAVRDLSKRPLNQDELKTLSALYEHSKEINKQLRDTQDKVIKNNLRWMDVEMALATQKEPHDNTIIDGFQTVNKKVTEYNDLNFGPLAVSALQTRNISMLGGQEVSAEDIKQKAAQFLNMDPSGLTVVENGANTEYHTYSVHGPKPNTHDGIHMDYTKKGGELLWYSASRNASEKKIDMRRARDIANEFLDNHGYKNMTMTSYEEHDNVADMLFAPNTDNVINYLEKVSVQVALDNGEVTGLQATDYVLSHKEGRQIKKPAISSEEARKALHPNFEVTNETLALVRNDLNEEVLCYEYTGKANGSDYRIYINAETGNQEKIDNLQQENAPQ
jgi:spore germination protein